MCTAPDSYQLVLRHFSYTSFKRILTSDWLKWVAWNWTIDPIVLKLPAQSAIVASQWITMLWLCHA